MVEDGKEKDDKHSEGQVEEKVYHELAKLGYTPLKLRQSFDSLQVINEFLQFIGTNQYYSDDVNKKLFLLGLDAGYAVISTEELMLKEKVFVDEMHIAIVEKKKPELDLQKLAAFKLEVEGLHQTVLDLSANAKKLITQIRSDFASREAFGFRHS